LNRKFDPVLSEFSVNEYMLRYEKARDLMEKYHIDALLLTEGVNIRYFAGYINQSLFDDKYFPALAILPRDSSVESTLVLGEGYGQDTSWISDVRNFSWEKGFSTGTANPIPVVKKAIDEKGLAESTIGMELGVGMRINLGQVYFDSLKKSLSKCRIVNASDLMFEVRSTKSESEIENIKKACEITCEGYRAGFESIRKGTSEKELASVIGSTMIDKGADFGDGTIIVSSGTEKLMWWDSTPSDYRFKRGDLIMVDGGCTYKGYFSDIIRTAIIGEPTKRQKEMYDVALKANKACLEVLKPGVAIGKIWDAAAEVWRQEGLPRDFERKRIRDGEGQTGHALGLDIHEPPAIFAGNKTTLKEGMVLAVEPWNTHNGVWPFREAKAWYCIEDNVVITRDGYELLTPMSKDLIIIEGR
jgi:Xaa-Pro aminopeptidase